jgi:hypothetical protein
VVSTFSKNATVGKTVAAALDEIRRLKKQPPAGDERTLAVNYLLGSYAGQRETPESMLDDLATLRQPRPAGRLVRQLPGRRRRRHRATLAGRRQRVIPTTWPSSWSATPGARAAAEDRPRRSDQNGMKLMYSITGGKSPLVLPRQVRSRRTSGAARRPA